jgi:hypothetical protein
MIHSPSDLKIFKSGMNGMFLSFENPLIGEKFNRVINLPARMMFFRGNCNF